MKSDVFRINHYVGAMLAQGGNIWMDEKKLIFSPTSALDRAMGAIDIEIPYHLIQEVEFKGDVRRTFNIKTVDKTHRFEGSQARQVWEVLDRAMKSGDVPAKTDTNPFPPTKTATAALHPKPEARGFQCHQCAHAIEAGYSFCPSCGTRIKATCNSCHKAVLSTWSVCAFCGWKFPPSSAANHPK